MEVQKKKNSNDKKERNLFAVLAGKIVLRTLQIKHSIARKSSKNLDEQKFADRIGPDCYSPFVKSTFRPRCDLWHKEERPMGCLRRAQSVADVFREAVKMHGDKLCMGFRPTISVREVKHGEKKIRKITQGGYKYYTYEDVNHLVEMYGRGMRSLGVEPGQNVVILADTCFEWMCMAQALMRNNIPIATVYATLSEEGILHGIKETCCSVVVVSQEMLEKMRNYFADIEHLEKIIYFERSYKTCPISIKGKKILSLFDLRQLGERVVDGQYPVVNPSLTDTAIIMYTSGSTGTPKGVILSHRNIIAAAKGLGEIFEAIKIQPDDTYVAYLPLAHVFEITCEMITLLYGVKIGYSSSQTLTDSGTLLDDGEKGDCYHLKPTIMAAVPLVLDRVKKGVQEAAKKKSALSECILHYAIEDLKQRLHDGMDTTVYDAITANIRSIVGGRLRFIACGSAPLLPDTQSFIRAALGCTILQGYGLTETCAAATCMEISDLSTGEVGCPVSGAYVRLADWPEGGYFVKDNKGEIIVGGDMICEGYYNNQKLTDESFFEEEGIRWFRTGDIGQATSRGTFKIIDRKKDLVKLQHGEYVSLGKVEAELRALSIVDNICVYGNSLQQTIVAVVQPNRQQLNTLATRYNKKHLSFEQLTEDEQIIDAVLEIIQSHAKSKKFVKFETPQRIKLCVEEWSPENELVTAAFKIRRNQIYQKYQKDLEELYL